MFYLSQLPFDYHNLGILLSGLCLQVVNLSLLLCILHFLCDCVGTSAVGKQTLISANADFIPERVTLVSANLLSTVEVSMATATETSSFVVFVRVFLVSLVYHASKSECIIL